MKVFLIRLRATGYGLRATGYGLRGAGLGKASGLAPGSGPWLEVRSPKPEAPLFQNVSVALKRRSRGPMMAVGFM
jgi:hypothetical protein